MIQNMACTPRTILTLFFSKELNIEMDIINTYVPSHDRKIFRDGFVDLGLLYLPFLILNGVLNFKTHLFDIWGDQA
jgi:hypothetical protein